MYHANTIQKKTRMAVLILYKVDFVAKNVNRNKDGNFMMIKKSISPEDLTILNVYATINSLKIYEAKSDRTFR